MLVFLLWFAITIIILLLIIFFIIFFSNIIIEFNNVKIVYDDSKSNNQLEFSILIKTYLFNLIKISSLEINKKKIEKAFKQIKLTSLYEKIIQNKKFDTKIISTARSYVKKYNQKYKESPIVLKQFNLNMEFGLLNVETTSYITLFLSTILSVPLPYFSEEYYKYKIVGEYEDNSIINVKLWFNSIIAINLKHIIIVLIKMLMGRVKKNDRTSNRRFNEYSYEQH